MITNIKFAVLSIVIAFVAYCNYKTAQSNLSLAKTVFNQQHIIDSTLSRQILLARQMNKMANQNLQIAANELEISRQIGYILKRR